MLAVEPDSGMNRSTNNNSPVSFKDNTSPLKRQHPVSSVLDSHNHLQQGLQEQSPLPSDHYIHSRLKSALGSGRKEVYYSGVLEGGRVRRVASLNAQAMNQMLCLTESALSVPNPRTDSPSVDSTLPPQDVDVLCTPLNGSLHNCKFPINFETKQALPDRTTSSLSDESSSSEEAISDTIMSSPLTSPSSSSTTAAATTTALLMPTVSPESTVKKASVDVVDVMKKRVRKQRNTDLKKTPSTVDSKTGFVKRMASLNAQAFVSVLVGSSRKAQAGAEGGKKRLRNSNYNNSKKRKVDQNDVNAEEVSKMGVDSSEDDATPSSTEPFVAQQQQQSLVCASSSNNTLCGSSSSSQDESHDDSQASSSCSLESVPCNTLGLLYSGDCISANKSILFTTEEHLPEREIPVIVPIHAFEVKFAVAKVLKQTSSAVRKRKPKANNGWTIESEPIKTITIRGQAGTKVCRKYYIGLKRQNERLFVRDSMLLRSGKRENPYVAKIASIWQEGGGDIMMTVFWYYRPEDTTPLVSSMFHESEIMASQHHDDVSVACVDDKCLVLGFSQYCRYMAARKRRSCQALCHSIVPTLSSDQDGSSSSHFHLTKQKGAAHVSSHEEGPDVYVCYRGYNHFTGRIVRAGISYK